MYSNIEGGTFFSFFFALFHKLVYNNNGEDSMAKKKSSKENEVKGFQYSVELTGLLLILVGIIGFGFGLVGSIIKKFAMFLVGEWWPIILLVVLYLGGYMIIKRKLPKFFNSKLTGLYVLVLVVLVLSHFTFIKECESAKQIFSVTIDRFMERADSMTLGNGLSSTGDTSIVIGGGVVGAVAATGLAMLFGMTGTVIVLVVLAMFGIVLLFDITLADILDKVRGIFKGRTRDEEDDDEEDDTDDEDEEEDNLKEDDRKIVITSVEELKSHNEPKEEVPLVTNTQTNESVSLAPYQLPPITILDETKKVNKVNSNEFIKNNKTILERVLNDFQIKGQVVEIHVGPAVTQYEVQIPNGTKVSKIVSINKEIALALAAKDVRIEAPIPGKSTIGVEIPNPVISPVRFREIVGNIPKSQEGAKLLVSLGKDIMGRVQTADISKMPHLLVAGSTGSGKSVCINSFIGSMLMRYRPDEVRLVMVDPKKVELSNYNGIPHLLCPVVTNPKKASLALQRIVAEMERRYEVFSEKEVKNIGTYNEWVDKENRRNPNLNMPKMPYIVVIIDELADLMLVAAKEVEDSIMRITQMARAAGIHLIVATQRPSTDVITGVVKANIPSRIAFAVASQIDSRTILDATGAEKLLGKGDMLYLPMGENVPIRIQGCFISDDEIRRLIEYVSKQQVAVYDNSLTEEEAEEHNPVSGDVEEYDDPLYNEIVEFAVQTGKVSASLLQRRFRLGYNRAARVVDLLEERGIVGPANGSKPREVLVKLDNGSNKEEQ